MHNGMLQTSGEKMAKSVGNIASLPERSTPSGAMPAAVLLLAH